jgi:hypothetical protein
MSENVRMIVWRKSCKRAALVMLCAALGLTSVSAQTASTARTQGAQTSGGTDAGPGPVGGIAASKFDPASYVTIYEEDRPNHRLLLFDRHTQSTLFRVDADSKIVVQLTGLTSDMALNGVVMTAELSRLAADAGPANVEVLNYSEVAKDPRTQASQAGVALRTASDVKTVLLNLYSTTRDAVAAAYQPECIGSPVNGGRPAGCTYQRRANADDELRVVLRASQPRIAAMTDFFTAERNGLVLSVIGARIFELDQRSLTATAGQFRASVATFIAGGQGAAQVAPELYLNLQRLWDDMQPLRTAYEKNPRYFDEEWEERVFPRFRDALSPGLVDLRRYKAADGEMLKLTIQSRAAGGEGNGGVSRDFHFAIKKLRPRVTTEPSAFYVRRQGDVRNDKGEVVAQKFSPAPGVTFGAIFYGRNPAVAVLAPGIGVNVSFMNFSTGDFDADIKDASGNRVGGFKASSGGSLQVGVGVTGSLFSNAVQFTVGRNLQVDDKRPWYAGVGFGFIQVAQELAKLAKK